MVADNKCTKMDSLLYKYTRRPILMKVLLAAGTDIDAVDIGNWTALHCAANRGYTDTVKLLIDKYAETACLHIAINAVTNGGLTALHCAAYNGYTDTVKLLIDKYAETACLLIAVNVVDDGNWTALRYATDNGHTDIVELLKAAGAK